MHTELSEEAEEQAQQQQKDSARTADQQEMAAAVEQATAEIGAAVAAREAESPVPPPHLMTKDGIRMESWRTPIQLESLGMVWLTCVMHIK